MKRILTRSTKITLEILLFLVLITIIAIGLARSFLPHLDRYKPYFEQLASNALHEPVQIEHIQASWKGLHPLINMENVAVLDKETQQPRLHIQRLQVGTHVIASLWHRRFVPSSITIFGTHIQAERSANLLDINGIRIPIATSNSPAASVDTIIGWLLDQGNIKLQDISVDWKDQNGRLLQLTHVTAGLDHGIFKNQVIGAATLVEKIPTHFRFVINLTKTGPLPQQVRANCYLFVKDLDLTPWLKELPPLPVHLTQGIINRLQLWAVWQNDAWQQLQTVVQLEQGQLNADIFSTSMSIENLTADLAWERRSDGFSFAADHIQLILNQQHWPLTQLSMQQAQSKGATVQIVRADALDLEQVRNLMTRLVLPVMQTTSLKFTSIPKNNSHHSQTPLPKLERHNLHALFLKKQMPTVSTMPAVEPWQNYVNNLQPQGKLTDLLIRRDISKTGDAAVSASTAFAAIKTLAWQNIPSIQGFQGKVLLTATSGDLQLNGHGLVIEAPQWFSHPFNLDDYQGHIQWIKLAEGFNIQANNFTLADNNLGVRTDFNLWLPAQANESPYIQLLTALSEKDGSRLRYYVPVHALVNHPALATWLTDAFVGGDGVEGQLVLQGPLTHFPFDDHTGRFDAAFTVKNMQFNYKPDWPIIENLNAQVLIDGKNLMVNARPGAKVLNATLGAIKAQIPNLAQPELTVQGNMQADMQQGLDFIAKSPLHKTLGEGLANITLEGNMALDLGLDIPLSKLITKPLAIQGNVTILPNGKLDEPDWKLHLTDLVGSFQFTEKGVFAQKLTAKWLGQPLDINADTQTVGDEHIILANIKGHVAVDSIVKAYALHYLQHKLSGGADYHIALKIHRKPEGPQATFSVDSDLVGVAIDLPEPIKKTAGEKLPIHVTAKAAEKSHLEVFVEYGQRLAANLSFAQSAHQNWGFKNADISFNNAGSSTLESLLAAAKIQVHSQPKGWEVRIDGTNARGNLTIPDDISSLWVGRFDRLRIMPGASQTAVGINPGDIPPLDLQFKNFSFGKRPIGSVGLVTSSGKNVMQIQRLKVDSANTSVVVKGYWQQNASGDQQTTISGNLTSDNIGAALKSWQITSSLVNGAGRVDFGLSWSSAAYDFDAKQLNGNFSLQFNKGSILNVADSKAAEMGIGRILNLLSFQSISKALTLDFSNLTEKGFPFDVIKGEFNIQRGNLLTDDAYIDGSIAKVAINGRIGVSDEDYNLQMSITPYVTSSLPIAATLVGGPIAGAATWVGSKVFGGIVNSITTRTYQVTGPWDKPVIKPAG